MMPDRYAAMNKAVRADEDIVLKPDRRTLNVFHNFQTPLVRVCAIERCKPTDVAVVADNDFRRSGV
jgi:hypothetical protein